MTFPLGALALGYVAGALSVALAFLTFLDTLARWDTRRRADP